MVEQGSTVALLWPLLPGSSDLLLLVVVCFPQLGPGARGRLLCRHPTSAALVKLDKWIKGVQIWAGIFEKRQRRCWRGAGAGGGGRRGWEEAKTFVLLDYKGSSRL